MTTCARSIANQHPTVRYFKHITFNWLQPAKHCARWEGHTSLNKYFQTNYHHLETEGKFVLFHARQTKRAYINTDPKILDLKFDIIGTPKANAQTSFPFHSE